MGEGVAGGREAGLEEFVAVRGPALLRLAWLLTADRDAAQDLVQEALAKVLPRWDRIVAGGDPEPYVRSAVRSLWVDQLRRRRFDAVPDLPPSAGDPGPGAGDARPDPGVEGTPERVDVAGALARLTPRQRAVLVLRFYEDLTEVQAAAVLGCSVSTVKSQTRHSLERLRILAPELVLLVRDGADGVQGVGGTDGADRAGSRDTEVTR